jgi:Leucine-rich repeat (LRR) protein
MYLYYLEFEGTIPESLLNLPKLYDFRINKNQLTGQIPETKQAGVLELLYLDSNKLTGFIPPSLSRHKRLASLRLFSNQLIGAIPRELSVLTSLDHLSLEFNQLQGSIPHELMESLSHLSELYLQGNAELSGTVPTQIGELADLKEFRAHDCSLTGSIPTEVGKLFRLEVLDVSNNKLGSTLPDLSPLEKLTHLRIGGNAITGVVDNDNCELTKVSLEEFSADCAGSSPDIVCACCTECL